MNRIFKISIIALLVLIVAITVGFAYTQVYLPQYYHQQSVNYYNQQLGMMGFTSNYGGQGVMKGPGMMRGYYGGFNMMGYSNGYMLAYTGRIPIGEAENLYTSGAKIFTSNDTIIFTSVNINITVLAMGHNRAFNLTHYTPPAGMHYSHNVFVVDGLINPTIIVPQGSIVHILLINLDAGDYHNLAITPLPPPYPYYTMMYVKMNVLGVTPMLPPANYANSYAYDFSISVTFSNPGVYYYICEYPGHAAMGMYGTIEVM
jgi:rusticyanin